MRVTHPTVTVSIEIESFRCDRVFGVPSLLWGTLTVEVPVGRDGLALDREGSKKLKLHIEAMECDIYLREALSGYVDLDRKAINLALRQQHGGSVREALAGIPPAEWTRGEELLALLAHRFRDEINERAALEYARARPAMAH